MTPVWRRSYTTDMNHANLFRPLIDRFREHAGVDPSVADNEEALIGFFQNYRPDGLALSNLYDDLPHAEELSRRVDRLFAVAGEDRRPQGGRDAYFVVRKAVLLSAAKVESHGRRWLSELATLGRALNQDAAVATLDPCPAIRVLQGVAPKHPKPDQGRTKILRTLLEGVPKWTEHLVDHPDADQLRRVFYFIACDPHLRDYLMWPLYADHIARPDPFSDYFELWRHRIKFRSFKEGQVDFYLPVSDPPAE